MTISDLYSRGELTLVTQGIYGCRKYKYFGVTSPWLSDSKEIKEWLKTFLVYLK